MRRHSTYDEDVAKELTNSKFASHFFLALMEGEDGMSLMDALKHTIYRMGVKEFSKKAKLHPKSVSRMLASHALPKVETLNQYLKPFGLKIGLVPEREAA